MGFVPDSEGQAENQPGQAYGRVEFIKSKGYAEFLPIDYRSLSDVVKASGETFEVIRDTPLYFLELYDSVSKAGREPKASKDYFWNVGIILKQGSIVYWDKATADVTPGEIVNLGIDIDDMDEGTPLSDAQKKLIEKIRNLDYDAEICEKRHPESCYVFEKPRKFLIRFQKPQKKIFHPVVIFSPDGSSVLRIKPRHENLNRDDSVASPVAFFVNPEDLKPLHKR